MIDILIDGSFIGKRITGVQRFNWETLKYFTEYPDLRVHVAVSEDVPLNNFNFPNVDVVRKGKKNNKFWQMFTLKKISKKVKLPLLCMSNYSPFYKKDYVVLHDVTYLDKEGKNKKFWSFVLKILIGYRLHKHKRIFTVSEFSKGRILYHYKKIKPEQIVVVGSGYEHWDRVEECAPEFEVPEEFYFAVGSTTANKNYEYVLKLAEANPDKNFIIAGRIDGDYLERTKNLQNINFCGYISDENLKYLFARSAGFILPSFYEGFGLPPLEALSCGCKRIFLSDIPVFREIYGEVATFFNPYDYNQTVDLSSSAPSPEAIKAVLEKYTWSHAAKTIYSEILIGEGKNES